MNAKSNPRRRRRKLLPPPNLKDGITDLYIDDNPDHDEGSAILWTALADGTYYAVVSAGSFTETGSYDFSISKPPADDVGNYHGTATLIPVPSVVTDSLNFAGDVDWFSFHAVACTHYEFATSLGTLNDSILRLYDKDGVAQLACMPTSFAADGLDRAASAGTAFVSWIW